MKFSNVFNRIYVIIIILIIILIIIMFTKITSATPSNNATAATVKIRKNLNINEINLIYDFIKLYKKINKVNILLCPTEKENWENFKYIIKQFIANGNILIKAIDIATIITTSPTTTTATTTTAATTTATTKTMTMMSKKVLHDILKIGDFKQIVVLDLSCTKSKYILEQASKYGLFNTSYHWFLLEDFPSQFEVEFFESLNINMNSEITLAKPQCAKRETYDLYDIWNPSYLLGGLLNVTYMANYSLLMGLNVNGNFVEATIIRRTNLLKLSIRSMIVITTKLTEPLELYLQHTNNPHLDSMHRFHFVLLSYLQDLFNFTLNMQRTDSWGYLNNGTFDGMIGALVRKEIDIGGSPIFFRIERAAVIDYTARTWIARPCFIFRHPQTNGLLRLTFLQPFTNNVWLSIFICGILAIIAIKVITSMEYRIFHDITKEPNTKKNSIKKCKQSNGKLHKEECISSKNFINIFSMWMKKVWEKISGNNKLKKQNVRQRRCRRRSSHIIMVNSNQHKMRKITKTFIATYAGVDFNNNKIDNNNNNTKNIKYNKNELNQNNNNRLIDRTISQNILLFLGVICQQGLTENLRLTSGRCIVTFLLLFGFCIYQFYSASIVGTLLMEKPKTIKNLRNLIDSSLDIGIEDIIYNRDFFKNTLDQDAVDLYKRKVQFINKKTGEITTNYVSPEEGLKMVKNGGYAFHVEVATAYKIIEDTFTEQEVCDLHEIPLLPPQYMYMVAIVQKGSPFREMITYGLRRIAETGLLNRQRKFWHSTKPKCVRSIHPEDLQVGMQTASSALFILLMGFTVSFVIFLFEICHHKLRCKNTNNNNNNNKNNNRINNNSNNNDDENDNNNNNNNNNNSNTTI